MTDDIAARFARETADHQMTVLHNDGLYRHLRFRDPKSSFYWFDLITVPGVLIFRGDGESYVFARLTDMFEFFRGSAWSGKPNVDYWAEKVTSGQGQLKKYNQELLATWVKESVDEHYEGGQVPADLVCDIQRDILEELTGDETYDRGLVESFEFYVSDKDRYAYPKKTPDFQFPEMWEVSFRDYDWWFLWSLHAILWGIAYHDSGTRPSLPEPKASKSAAPHTNEPKRRAVIDVELPAVVNA